MYKLGICERMNWFLISTYYLSCIYKCYVSTCLICIGGKKTKTANKKEPSERVRKLLEQGMKPEMELYTFVKKRFTEQFQILKSKGEIY